MAATLGACGVKESFADASQEVAAFHQALDAGQIDRVWTTADPMLRKAGDKEDFERLLDAVRRKLGKVTESVEAGSNYNATNNGTFVILTMHTTFEKGTGTETFTYRKGDADQLTLAGYNIDSQDMMLN